METLVYVVCEFLTEKDFKSSPFSVSLFLLLDPYKQDNDEWIVRGSAEEENVPSSVLIPSFLNPVFRVPSNKSKDNFSFFQFEIMFSSSCFPGSTKKWVNEKLLVWESNLVFLDSREQKARI